MTDPTTQPRLGHQTIGECSFCGDKETPVVQGPGLQICLKCSQLAAEIHGVIPPPKTHQELLDEALGTHKLYVAKRVRGWFERAAAVGTRLESSALTWLDAAMLRNRNLLVTEHWRSGRWWVVMPKPACDEPSSAGVASKTKPAKIKGTAFLSRDAAMAAAKYDPKAVTEVHFASLKADGDKRDINPVVAMLGIATLGFAGIMSLFGGKKRQ